MSCRVLLPRALSPSPALPWPTFPCPAALFARTALPPQFVHSQPVSAARDAAGECCPCMHALRCLAHGCPRCEAVSPSSLKSFAVYAFCSAFPVSSAIYTSKAEFMVLCGHEGETLVFAFEGLTASEEARRWPCYTCGSLQVTSALTRHLCEAQVIIGPTSVVAVGSACMSQTGTHGVRPSPPQ